MNRKKISVLIISIIITILLMIVPSKVSAVTTLTTPLYFGIQEFRQGTTPEKLAYAIRNPYANGATIPDITGAKIWQIVKHNSSTDENFTTGNYYCVKAGIGFSDTKKKAEYNISYDLKTEKAAIASSGNQVLQSIVDDRCFYKLLALTDLVYLQGVSTVSERTALLEAAGIYNGQYEYMITDSDIEAVQQAAMWYFTKEDLTQMYPDFSIEKHGELLVKRYRKAHFQAFINQYYQLVITLEDFFLPADNPMYIDYNAVL